ncbi:hypothetical protein B296_00029948, partial [Ensete ventricosum]
TGAAPTEASPLGTAPVGKGGACGHNARPPTGTSAPAAKGVARGQGDRWMRAKGES